jgi:galactonate dehydratase
LSQFILAITLTGSSARRLGLPIYQLLGGKVRDKLKVYAWIGGDRPGDVEAQAYVGPLLERDYSSLKTRSRARIAQGFRAVKMNATEDLAWLDSPHALDTSVERLKTVKSLGIDAGVDFHGRVHKAMALQLAHKLTPHEPLFIEEPLLSEHPESIAALSRLVPVPIALGERLHSRWDIKPFLESASVSILQPDICHVGGISELRRIAIMAEAYDVALAPHCPLGPIALAANIQVDAVSANFAIQEMSLGIHYNAGSADIDTYIKNPDVWKVRHGLVELMNGPGLGIEVDEDKVRAASVNAVAWRSPSFRGPGGEWREW